VPNLSHVYSGRRVLPARFTKLRVRVVNADTCEHVIRKGTRLLKLERAEVVETSNELSSKEPLASKVDVVEQMMSSLPKELTKQQQRAVKELLSEHENIFSKGEYDIRRTPYVEYRIDTGAHRSIRQALRRHPCKYLDGIDEQLEEVKAHGIIEPAASPWASNVVLVRKKDNSLRFCIDYRQPKRITVQDSYPIPLMDNCLNAL